MCTCNAEQDGLQNTHSCRPQYDVTSPVSHSTCGVVMGQLPSLHHLEAAPVLWVQRRLRLLGVGCCSPTLEDQQLDSLQTCDRSRCAGGLQATGMAQITMRIGCTMDCVDSAAPPKPIADAAAAPNSVRRDNDSKRAAMMTTECRNKVSIYLFRMGVINRSMLYPLILDYCCSQMRYRHQSGRQLTCTCLHVICMACFLATARWAAGSPTSSLSSSQSGV